MLSRRPYIYLYTINIHRALYESKKKLFIIIFIIQRRKLLFIIHKFYFVKVNRDEAILFHVCEIVYEDPRKKWIDLS